MGWMCAITGPNGPLQIGEGFPLAIIGGPCVLEDPAVNMEIARTLRDACAAAGARYIFKASFDKANRTSVSSSRGPGIDAGLQEIGRIRRELGVPVTTDIHTPEQAGPVGEVVDILQIPAFLCRQTDLLTAAGAAAARLGKAVNVKKGQFLAPEEMAGPIGKLAAAGCSNIILTERGTFFGYHRLVNDFIGLGDLMATQWENGARPPVCFDCTHSAQLPGLGATTGGRRERVPLLARAAAAAGVHAMFMECHPTPERARSDASTMLALADAPALIRTLCKLSEAVRGV
jgi:2-dehydro-3-deoxyphosphooctonate aldolase (KDO 8-P synthase)